MKQREIKKEGKEQIMTQQSQTAKLYQNTGSKKTNKKKD